MAIKPICKFFIGVGACFAVNASYAVNWIAKPYAGLEYKLGYTKGNGSWKQLLPTNKMTNAGSMFVGLRFHRLLAGELGFSQSTKTSKTSFLGGTTMFGVTAVANANQKISLKYSSWSFDLNARYPTHHVLTLLGSIGLESIKPKLYITNLGAAATNITTVSGKTKTVPRIGVGVQYVKGMFGVRSKITWAFTSKLRFNKGTYAPSGVAASNANVTNKPFRDSYGWTLGAFVRW
jgi:hypothetical protein